MEIEETKLAEAKTIEPVEAYSVGIEQKKWIVAIPTKLFSETLLESFQKLV